MYRLAKKVDALEMIWRINLERFFEKITDEALDSFINKGKAPDPDFEKFFTDHAFAIAVEALRDSRPLPVGGKKLAGPPKGVVPKSLSDLMRQWDKYRKTGKVPPRQREIARKVKREYLNRVQDFWKKHSEDFRTGDVSKVYDQRKVREALQEESRASYARSKMIVETETTYYYNQVRRKYYDASDDVTHYLFMAIRDHRTTAWCKTRHEIVYAKGDPITDKETPPVHWNCRSEMLPLTPINPVHRKLIDDTSRARRQNSPEPLPKGWGKR